VGGHLARLFEKKPYRVTIMTLKKPSILLHICCAPDATAVFEQLQEKYSVVGYFHNPNIYPEEEYRKRLKETEYIAKIMNFPLDFPRYKPQEWLAAVKGFEQEPEKGKRCRVCFCFNLRATAKKALKSGIPYFTTTLTISPHKKTAAIFAAGKEAASEFGPEFMAFDFKKKDGFKRSLIISRKLNLYRQNYCGCSFSLREQKNA
jgi:predicted adenine nucleotide alpha hydrolase (AANH) superfamily ATPase